ncbi:ABC transporter ATP-binding protein [Phaeobacter italicus]|jgi:flagellar assembly protein FliH|uniref:ABC transporter ATP-binding protein n=1 Tax=Phaeobacter italicus TaxID=481446 RepID=UPI00242C420A|nr:ABC transporter ATP-binding protein [Phaeobacter italicus]MCI5100792.1 ABC transporter ATP-binding protein [Phaeobacter italicus]
MTIAHLLEDFAPQTPVVAMPEINEAEIEEQKLASYETGYSAGWDDAVTAKDNEVTKISSELASSLEDLSFTFHEAQSQLLETLDPMFKVLTSAVLPDAMAASFGHHIVDQLTDMAKSQADQPINIVVSPGEGAAVRALLTRSFSVPVTVREDVGLSAGQAYLKVGGVERELNSAALIDAIKDSIDAFSHQMTEDSNYG